MKNVESLWLEVNMTRLQEFLSSPIPNVAGMARRHKNGDLFGIELECEGKKVDWDGTEDIAQDWAPHRDGSLRDHHGTSCEWVFNGPVTYKQSVDRINKLFDYFDGRKAKLVTSNRTSTHVHFNMGDKAAYQLVNMFILFTILEDVLDTYCGEDRRGNLFCLSARHAEDQVRWMESACFRQYQFGVPDNNRYTSFNTAAIHKFGTVEFRGMRGLDNREDMLNWLSILNDFVNYSCYTMKSPSDLVEGISQKTPDGLLREVFSEKNYDLLVKGRDQREISDGIYDGLRLVQMLCYKIGTEFHEVKLRGRDFWGSFKDEIAVERDVEPQAIKAPKPRAPRAAALAAFANEARPIGMAWQARVDAARPELDRLAAEQPAPEHPKIPAGPLHAGLRQNIRLGRARFLRGLWRHRDGLYYDVEEARWHFDPDHDIAEWAAPNPF